MNILANLNSILNPQSQSLAKVVGIKTDGTIIAKELNGGVVLLKGQAAIGEQVFYDRYTSAIVGKAPDVGFGRFGV